MNVPTVVVVASSTGRRAAGHEERLAQRLDETTVLGRTLSAVVAAGLPLVVVASPALVPLAQTVVAARDILLATPEDTAGRGGLARAFAVGVSARAHAPGWLLLPGDTPGIQPATLQAVQRALPDAPIVIAQCRGRRGHPIGFSQELFTELCHLSDDERLRRLLARYPGREVEVDDAGVHGGIDAGATLGPAGGRLAATLGPRRNEPVRSSG